jgi:hypothetical protein
MRNLLLCVIFTLLTAPAFALYDPNPLPEISGLQGHWQGTLTYNDYSSPGKLVTLKTTLYSALLAPNEIIWHLVFDDGPNKTVYSYERLRFDLNAKQLTWISGANKPNSEILKIMDVKTENGILTMGFEIKHQDETASYTLVSSAQSLELNKYEIESNGERVFRNAYKFFRATPLH